MKLTLEISIDKPAFTDNNYDEELSRIMDVLRRSIRTGSRGNLFDFNYNHVGTWKVVK